MTNVKGFEISCRPHAYCEHIKQEKKVLIHFKTQSYYILSPERYPGDRYNNPPKSLKMLAWLLWPRSVKPVLDVQRVNEQRDSGTTIV